MNENKRKIAWSKQFKKDLKEARKQNRDIDLLFDIVYQLANDIKLDPKHKDHKLKGKLKDYRECHLLGDWLLVYEKPDAKRLVLLELGSHSRLKLK